MKRILQFALAACFVLCAACLFSQAVGTIDSSFGTNGRVYLPDLNYNLTVEKMKVLPDGKMLVLYSESTYGAAINFSYLTRFNADGTIDNTFATGGTYNMRAEGLYAKHFVVNANGKIGILGVSLNTGTNDYDLVIVVLNENGTPNTGFSTDGKMELTNPSLLYEQAGGLLFQPDGKIVTAETYYSSSSANHYGMLFQRVDSTGNFDFGFGTLGYFVSEISGKGENLHNIYLKSDGRILAAGGIHDITSTDGDMGFLAMFNSTGMDATWGSSGYTTYNSISQLGANSVSASAIFPDETVALNGITKNAFYGYVANKSMHFNTNGAYTETLHEINTAVLGITTQDNSNVICAGADLVSKNFLRVERTNADAQAVTNFVFVDSVDYHSEANSTDVTADGKIMVACTVAKTSASGEKSQLLLLRLNGEATPQVHISCATTNFNSPVGTPTTGVTASLSALYITGNVTVNASSDFEVSTNGSSYSQQITLAQSLFNNGNSPQFYLRFNPTQTGANNGTVTATSGNATATLNVTGNTSTGIENLSVAVLSIYPNPTYNFLEINFNKTNSAGNEISIINLLGEEVLRATTVEESTKLNVSSLASGLYFLRSGNSTKRFEKY